MSLQVLLSSMHMNSYKYIDSLNITTDCVIINQCNVNNEEYIYNEGRNIKYISTTERGLSLSRNKALDYATAEICLFCDNDVEYKKNYRNIVMDEFRKNPEYDIIVFPIDSKPYFKKKKMGYISTLKVFSPEIAFRRKSIEQKNIRFTTHFGAGAKYSMGEENIFLYDCLKKGLKILYVPVHIANERDEESTWFKGYNKKYFFDKGAIYYEMSNKFCVFLILQFAVRKHKIFKDEVTRTEAIKYMLRGRKEYRREIKTFEF